MRYEALCKLEDIKTRFEIVGEVTISPVRPLPVIICFLVSQTDKWVEEGALHYYGLALDGFDPFRSRLDQASAGTVADEVHIGPPLGRDALAQLMTFLLPFVKRTVGRNSPGFPNPFEFRNLPIIQSPYS